MENDRIVITSKDGKEFCVGKDNHDGTVEMKSRGQCHRVDPLMVANKFLEIAKSNQIA